MLKRILTAAVAAVVALAASAPAVYAQKALVYCPVGIDATGCDRIVTALQSTFTDGVDRGYDGSNGTVDLSKIDLHHYGVFVVPSLADDATKQPYALLRSVASRLHFAITGRVAVYSGAPDQGSTNRSDKDALIQNLATWAANGHSRATGLVGLVAFLDLSEHAADRYSWVRDVSLTDVSADAQLTAFGDVQAVSPRGSSVLSAGGRSVRFSNMASYGLHIGRRAAARTEVGALGGSAGAQSVLVMYSNADGKDGATSGGTAGTGRVGATGASLDVTGAKASLSSGTTTGSTLSSGTAAAPTITTDKPDYLPGDTVTFTGTGFAAGDTVTITVHEDPTWSYPDRQFVAVADANGAFTDRDMIVQQLDLGVTFTATAVAVPSGLVAQTTFTDAAPALVMTKTANGAFPEGGSGSYTLQVTNTGNGATNGMITVVDTVGGSGTSFTGASGTNWTCTPSNLTAGRKLLTCTATQVLAKETANTPTPATPITVNVSITATQGTTVTNRAWVTGGGDAGNHGDTLDVTISAPPTFNLTVAGTGAGTGTVTSSPAGINCTVTAGATSGTCTFAFNSGSNVSLTATQSTNSPTAAGSTFAAWTGDATGTTSPVSVTMSANRSVTAQFKANQTITFTAPTGKTYGDADFDLAATTTSPLAVSYGTSTASVCTIVSGKLHILTAGDCTATASQAGDALNYNAAPDVSRTFTIAKKTVTATVVANNKVYDGTTAATLASATLSGFLAADENVVGVDYSAATKTFDNKNVGNGKTVTVTGLVLSGPAASNYVLSSTTVTTTANVTPLTIAGAITASNKVYDGTATAAIATRTLTGAIVGDVVSLTGGTATFADKNVGTGKTVTGTGLTLTGTDAPNYALASATLTTTADITALGITGSFAAANKTYDGTTAATVNTRSLTGQISGDAVSLIGGSATFADKNVGTNKTVTLTGATLSGGDAGNYTLNAGPITSTANITALGVTGSIVTKNKVYDGNTIGTSQTASVVTAISGDIVTLSGGTLAFNDKNVGTAKPVTATGWTLSGANAGNYSLGTVTASAADITAVPITASITAENKVYDGTTTATVHGSALVGIISPDAVTLNVGAGSFSDKNVGTNKAVTASVSLAGNDAGNYSLTNPSATATATASITQRALTVSATGVNKVYDATTTATVTLSDNRVAGDALTDAYTGASFGDKNVGTGKTVSVSGISVSGSDAGNYTFNTTASTTANITARALTVSATGVNKVYDGNANATVTLGDDRVSGDLFTSAYASASFNNKNVGTAKSVSVSGISISGTDAGNYTANTTASTTADITARALTVSATGIDKVYDGTITATVTLGDNRISGDMLTDSYTNAAFQDKHVGAGKTVNVYGIAVSGTDAGNYTANSSASTTASITQRPLTVSAAGHNKVYDGNPAATVTISDNRVSGDVFSVGYTSATFADKNVGAGKTVTVNGISLSGADAGDYSSNPTASTTADITPLAIIGSITASDKIYDGTTAATIATRTLAGAVSGDVVTYSGGTATFADKNVGTGKSVTATGLGLSGGDAGNYTVNSTAATTASITPRGVTGSITTNDKVYDGGSAATAGTKTVVGAVSGDYVSLSGGTVAFADKNVGTSKPVSASGWVLTGGDAGNYTLGSVTASSANVTPFGITGSITASNKVYDGTTAATIASRTLAGVIGLDVVSYVGGSANFGNKNVGTGKSVTATGLSLSGADAGNYTVNTTASTAADITPRSLTITATGVNKVYDNSTTATVTLGDNRVTGDVFTDGYGSAAFASKDVGTGIGVSVSGIVATGTDAPNYTFNTTAATAANITQRPVSVKVDDQQVVWTGSTITPSYTISLTAGTMAPGETFYSTLGTPVFSPATVINVGTYPETVTGLTNSNYAISANPGMLKVLDQTAPVGMITSLNPVPLNTSAILTVNISDVNTGNSKIASWQYTIDGGTPVPVSPSSTTSNLTQSVTIPGFSTTDVKQVCVVGTDAGGNPSTAVCALLAVYDPSAGFVTGGGWINSPAGAYTADPTLTGRANFGFVSKYQKGANTPTGNTEFQFQAGNLNFHSTSFQWLVISGTTQAQFKGTGTINGTGSYNFIVTAIDGDNFSTKQADAFRIKITDASGNVIYDNQPGSDTSGAAQAISGGSIQIQSK